MKKLIAAAAGLSLIVAVVVSANPGEQTTQITPTTPPAVVTAAGVSPAPSPTPAAQVAVVRVSARSVGTTPPAATPVPAPVEYVPSPTVTITPSPTPAPSLCKSGTVIVVAGGYTYNCEHETGIYYRIDSGGIRVEYPN